MLLLTNATSNAADDESMILVGSKDESLAIVKSAMQAEFTNGTVTETTSRVGFHVHFHSFWTAQSDVYALFSPMSDEDALEPTAYKIDFEWQVQKMGVAGANHVKSLKTQIIRQIAKQSLVSIPSDANSYRMLNEQANRCFANLANDVDLQSLKNKVALSNTDDQTFEMLANEITSTEDEKKAIYLWATKREICRQPVKIHMTFWPTDPQVPLYKTLYASIDQLILALYKGNLTYGQFAKARQELTTKAEESSRKIMAAMKDHDDASNERARLIGIEEQKALAAQSAARAAANAAQTAANAERLKAFKPPVRTNLNCTSQRIGDSVYTNCN